MTNKKRQQQYIGFTQNFIHNTALANKIIDYAAIKAGETVLEIGPGKGILARALAQRVTKTGSVVAVEYDKRLVDKLTIDFKSLLQVKIEHGDILQFDLQRLPGEYLVVSNIPFNITSEILELLFTTTYCPQRAYLVLQNDALIGKGYQGSAPTETFKSLLIKPAYDIQSVYAFSRNDFKPRPNVDTSLFAFTHREQPLIDISQYELYKDFLAFISKDRVGEGTWRKVFSKRQMTKMIEKTGLIANKGLKSQSVAAIASAFAFFTTIDRSKQSLVHGAMTQLRAQQQKMEQINHQGSHRRRKR